MRRPFFYDITLRDGNQSLKNPLNMVEKEIIFEQLLKLGVQGIEVGFAAASKMDYDCVSHLSQISSNRDVVISSLARATKYDIDKANECLSKARKRRIHTFITLSPFHMENVLCKSANEVRSIAIDSVDYAKRVLPKGSEIEFSVEHFGCCGSNIDFVIDTLKEIVKKGASIINLPNTVERARPKYFLDLVERVYDSLPKDVIISVHNHNDLGMATAVTVESYFLGAIQLECSLNGLGERAGNTNLYEVAIALYNSGVEVDLKLDKIYETAVLVSELTKVKIGAKSPLIGSEALAHRSGIHQDGAIKTKDLGMGAYIPIKPELIGRKDHERIGFTSQSGKSAIFEIVSSLNLPISINESAQLLPYAKELAQKRGELTEKEIVEIYFDNLYNIKGAFVCVSFEKCKENEFRLEFTYKAKSYVQTSVAIGPVEGCLKALKESGFDLNLKGYEQIALEGEKFGSKAIAVSIFSFVTKDGKTIQTRAKDESTFNANIKAIFNALNIIYS